eukprot:s360_g10.t1
MLQPHNGIFILSWYDDPNDTALFALTPLLEELVATRPKVHEILEKYKLEIPGWAGFESYDPIAGDMSEYDATLDDGGQISMFCFALLGKAGDSLLLPPSAMDGFLRALFLSKGFQEEQLDTIEAKDKDLRSVNDLAAGATSEDDARAWSEELGLSGRVQKSRFVQAWAEARTQGNIGRPAQSSAPAANGYVDMAPASRNATPVEPPPAPVDPPRAVERYVEDRSDRRCG